MHCPQLNSLAVLLGLLILSGCGGSPDDDLRGVSGTVTLNGEPLASGTVGLVDSQGNAAGVGIIENGNFNIVQSANFSGVLPGTYRVMIESWKVEPGAVLEDGSFATGESVIPEKYNSHKTSELEIVVPEEGITSVTLELTP